MGKTYFISITQILAIMGSLLFLVVLAYPDTAIAQSSFVPCEGTGVQGCNACHFVEMGNTILVWLIGILFMFHQHGFSGMLEFYVVTEYFHHVAENAK